MPVTVVDYPSKLPSKCLNCKSPYPQDGRKYLDLHIDLPRYGRMYLCTLCFNEIANLVGYVSREEVKDLSVRLDSTLDEISRLLSENGTLRTALTELSLLVPVATGIMEPEADNEREESTVDDSGRTDEESSVSLSEGERGSEEDERGSTEPLPGVRLSGIPETFSVDLGLT